MNNASPGFQPRRQRIGRSPNGEAFNRRKPRRFTALPLLCLLLAVLVLSGCSLTDKYFSDRVAAAAAQPPPTPAPEEGADQPRTPFLAYLWPPNWPGMIFPKTPDPPQALPPQVIGVVKMVNSDDGFVLIDAVSLGNTEPGVQLICISNQKETATLRMGGLKNPPFLIADIVSGTPSPGDKVLQP